MAEKCGFLQQTADPKAGGLRVARQVTMRRDGAIGVTEEWEYYELGGRLKSFLSGYGRSWRRRADFN
jgi:hypothetical protein